MTTEMLLGLYNQDDGKTEDHGDGSGGFNEKPASCALPLFGSVYKTRKQRHWASKQSGTIPRRSTRKGRACLPKTYTFHTVKAELQLCVDKSMTHHERRISA